MPVIGKKRPQAFLTFVIVLLIVGTVNHCVFEDLFASFSKIVFGAEVPEHHPNHLGSNAPHKDSDAPESHEHGQPHHVIAVHFGKTTSDILKMMIAVTSLCFVVLYTIGFTVVGRKIEAIPPFATGEPPGLLGNFISSLTLAPQAPPI